MQTSKTSKKRVADILKLTSLDHGKDCTNNFYCAMNVSYTCFTYETKYLTRDSILCRMFRAVGRIVSLF